MRPHLAAIALVFLSSIGLPEESRAASLAYSLGVVDFGAPSTFGFFFLSPYIGGPYNAIAASVGGALTDLGGNGATLTGSIVNKVDGTTASTIPLSCTIGAGSPGTIASCPNGAGTGTTASATLTTGDGGVLSQTLTFMGSGGGDTVALTGTALLGGGDGPFLVWAVGIVDFGAPSLFQFSFSLPFIGQFTNLTTSLMGAFGDFDGNGAAVNQLELETSIDGSEVAGAAITGSCASGPGLVVVQSCLAGLTFSGLVTPFAAPASGTFGIDILFTLSGGNDAAALTGMVELLNATFEVPGPATLFLLAVGAVAVGALSARRRRG
jgi:hypothetical protein